MRDVKNKTKLHVKHSTKEKKLTDLTFLVALTIEQAFIYIQLCVIPLSSDV